MTRKIFWGNPYLTGIETTLTGVSGNAITVDQTVFFAESGGQESDHGFINDHRVIQARIEGREIEYALENGHGLQVGQRVKMTIDWERRYSLMRLHFAAELILELAYQNLKGIVKIEAHIAHPKARIDFKWDENISRYLPALEKEALGIIDTNQVIESAYSNEMLEKRYWKVEGFAKVPCAGTHLCRTGEIGRIKLKREYIGKGKERIEIRVSDDRYIIKSC
jgi:Ser-tRNA(Ala) deacylase AlaX